MIQYPPIEPFNSGMLEVSPGEKIYWEECGDKTGVPIVFIHGGPGAGCSETSRRFFNPQKYRVVLWDQRGCGRSQSHSPLTELTLEHLVQDLELLRQHLQIEKWVLFGGSWGTTLGLTYAKIHTQCVSGLLLRGVFMASSSELAWLYQEGGASQLFPQEWSMFTQILDQVDRVAPHPNKEAMRRFDQENQILEQKTWRDYLGSYLNALQSQDLQIQEKASYLWAQWEHSIMSVTGLPKLTQKDNVRNLSMAIQSCHLFLNDPWLRDEKCWESFESLQHLPCWIIQGQFDVVTPMRTAHDLHRKWKNSILLPIAGAGHASSDPALMQALVKSLDLWPVKPNSSFNY